MVAFYKPGDFFSSFASDRDSGEWVEVAIEGLAEEMLGQVWMGPS